MYLYGAIEMSSEDEPFRPHAYSVDSFTLMYTVGADVTAVHSIYFTHSASKNTTHNKHATRRLQYRLQYNGRELVKWLYKNLKNHRATAHLCLTSLHTLGWVAGLHRLI